MFCLRPGTQLIGVWVDEGSNSLGVKVDFHWELSRSSRDESISMCKLLVEFDCCYYSFASTNWFGVDCLEVRINCDQWMFVLGWQSNLVSLWVKNRFWISIGLSQNWYLLVWDCDGIEKLCLIIDGIRSCKLMMKLVYKIR